MEALKRSLFADKDHHKEHVNEYIFENPSNFKIGNLKISSNKCAPNLSLTVDTEKDYQKLNKFFKKSKNQYLETEEAIKICLQYV